MVEDALKVAAHDERVHESPERPERQRVAHLVAHDGAGGMRGELVPVVPELIRTTQLAIDEAAVGLPR
ncbi:MAG TPA: hypothetical protein VK510_14885, partial [Solirubrobacteraceae bacterium]|nr:hypothetical protein [Solirubrobacteraceae bacterium]